MALPLIPFAEDEIVQKTCRKKQKKEEVLNNGTLSRKGEREKKKETEKESSPN